MHIHAYSRKKKKNSRAGLEALAFWAVQRTMHYEGGNGK
jgi:hypothetical protein